MQKKLFVIFSLFVFMFVCPVWSQTNGKKEPSLEILFDTNGEKNDKPKPDEGEQTGKNISTISDHATDLKQQLDSYIKRKNATEKEKMREKIIKNPENDSLWEAYDQIVASEAYVFLETTPDAPRIGIAASQKIDKSQIEILSLDCYKDSSGNKYYFTGSIKNVSSQPRRLITLQLVIYNTKGEIIHIEPGTPEKSLTGLRPSEETKYNIVVTSLREDMGSFELIVNNYE